MFKCSFFLTPFFFFRGEEMGYFAFGGSTILVIFKKGVINYDDDLRINSTKALETLVKMGSSLGVKA